MAVAAVAGTAPVGRGVGTLAAVPRGRMVEVPEAPGEQQERGAPTDERSEAQPEPHGQPHVTSVAQRDHARRRGRGVRLAAVCRSGYHAEDDLSSLVAGDSVPLRPARGRRSGCPAPPAGGGLRGREPRGLVALGQRDGGGRHQPGPRRPARRAHAPRSQRRRPRAHRAHRRRRRPAGFGSEYWIGFSFRLGRWDAPLPSWATLFQFHAVPGNEDWTNCVAGRNPFTVTLSDGQVGVSVVQTPYLGPPPVPGGAISSPIPQVMQSHVHQAGIQGLLQQALTHIPGEDLGKQSHNVELHRTLLVAGFRSRCRSALGLYRCRLSWAAVQPWAAAPSAW